MFDGFFIPSTESFEERDLFAWLRQREETGWIDRLFKADAGGAGAPAAPTVKQPQQPGGAGAGGGTGAPSVHAPSVSAGGGGGSSAKLGSEAPAHRWLRRELKGAKASGGNEYRYFYTEGQGLGRVAKEGAEVNLGHKKGTDDHIRVTKVDRENNKITYKKLKANKDDAGNLTHFDEHEGEHTTDSKGWNSMMEQHFGDSHHTATDARVRRWANAVYTKVPHEVFKQTWDDATGSKMTGDQIVAHLKASSDKVHQKMGKSLERTFRDNGIGDEHDAREAIGFLLSRRGWHPSARAAMLGMMEHGGYEAARVAKNYRTIARSAEKSAKNGMVTGAHLHAALRGTKTVGQYHEAKSSRMATLLHEHNEDLHKRGEKPVSMDDFQMFRKAHAGKRAWETRQKNKENTPTQKRMFGKVEDMSADEFAAWHKTTKEKEDKREKKFTEEFLDSPLPAAAASEEEKAAPHAEGKLVEQLQSAKGGKAGARENKELDAYVKGLSPEQKEAWDRNHEYYLQKWRDARAAREAGKKTAKTAPGVSAAPAGIDYAKDTPQAREERLRNPARRRETGTISPDLQRDFVDRMRRDLEKQGHGELDYPTIANYAREASKAYEKNFGDKVPAGHFAEAGVQYLNGGFPELPRYRPGQSPPPPSTTKQSAEGGHVPETRGPVGAAPKQSMAEAAAEMYGSAAPARPAVYTPEGLTPEQHRENVAAMKAGSPLPHKVGPDRERLPETTSGATMPDVAAEAGAGVGVSSGTAAANQDDDWAALRARHGEGLADVVGEGPEEESLHDQLHGDAKLAYQGADDAALADVRRRFEAARGQLTSEEGEALHQHISDIEQQRARDKDAEDLPERDVEAGAKQYHTARGAAVAPVPEAAKQSSKPLKGRAPTIHDDALELVQQGLDQYGSPLEGRWPQEHVNRAHEAVTQALAASLPDIAAQDPSVRQTPSLLERMHADLTRAKQGERKDTDLSGVFAPVGSSSVTPRSTPQQRAAEVLSNSLWDVNNREQHERPGHLAAVEQLVDEQHRKGLIGATEHRNLHVQLQNAKQRHGLEPHPVDQDVELAGQAATHAPDDVAEHLRDAVEGVHKAAAQGDADAGEHAEKVLAAAEELAEQGAIDEETVDDLHDELGDVVATHPVPEQEVRPVPAPPAEQPADSSAASEPAIAEVAGESAPVDAEKPRGAEPFERPPGSAGKSTGTLQVEQMLSDPAFMAAPPKGREAKVAQPAADGSAAFSAYAKTTKDTTRQAAAKKVEKQLSDYFDTEKGLSFRHVQLKPGVVLVKQGADDEGNSSKKDDYVVFAYDAKHGSWGMTRWPYLSSALHDAKTRIGDVVPKGQETGYVEQHLLPSPAPAPSLVDVAVATPEPGRMTGGVSAQTPTASPDGGASAQEPARAATTMSQWPEYGEGWNSDENKLSVPMWRVTRPPVHRSAQPEVSQHLSKEDAEAAVAKYDSSDRHKRGYYSTSAETPDRGAATISTHEKEYWPHEWHPEAMAAQPWAEQQKMKELQTLAAQGAARRGKAPQETSVVDVAVPDESEEESEAPSDGGWEPLDDEAVARLDERDAAVRHARKALKNKQITQEEADAQIKGAHKRYELAEQAAKEQGEEDEYPEEETPSMPPWDAEVQPPSANHEHLTPDELEDAALNAHEEGSATDEDHEIIQALPKTDKKGKPSEKGYSQAERNGVSLVVGKALQQLADHYNDHNGEHMSSDMALSNAYEDFEPEEFDYTDDKGNDKTGKAKMPSSKTFHEQAVRYLDSVRWREKEGVPPQTGPSETPTVDAAVEQDSPAPAVEDAREPDVLPPSDVAALGGAARTSSDMVLDTTPSVDVERRYTLPRKDFPTHIKQALREQKHNRKDYEVRVGNTFSPWGSATDGTRPHTSLVDLKTGKVRHSEGAWGGDDLLAQMSSLHDPNQDYKAQHEIPKGHAVVVGQTGYEPATTAHIHMRPEDYDAHFGANVTSNQVPTVAQKKVLDALSMMSHARERHFQESKLGAYSPNNSRVKELIELGWVQPTPKGGLQLTTKGKNAQRLLGIAGVPYKKEDAAPPSARTVVHDVEVEGAPPTAPALEALSAAAQSTPPPAAPAKKEEPTAPVASGGRPSFVRNAPRRRGAGLMPSDDELSQMAQAAGSSPSVDPKEGSSKPATAEHPLVSALGADREPALKETGFSHRAEPLGLALERVQRLQDHFGVPETLERGVKNASVRNTVLQQGGFGVPREHAAGWRSEHNTKLHDALSLHSQFPTRLLRSKYANSGGRVQAKDAERLQRYMGDGYSPLNHAGLPLTDADMRYMREVRSDIKDHVAETGRQTRASYEGERSVGGPSTKGKDPSSATPEAVDEQRQLADHRGALDAVWSKDEHPAKVAAHGALNAAVGGNHKAAIAGMADVVKHEFFGKNASHTDEAARHHALTQLAAVNASAALADAKAKNEAVDKGTVVQDAVKAVANDFGPLASPGPARKDGKAGPNVVDRWVDSALEAKSGASVQEAVKKTGDKDHGALFDKTAKASSRSASMLRWLSRLGKGFGKLASTLAVAAAMAAGSAGVLPESSLPEAAAGVHREEGTGVHREEGIGIALPSVVPSFSDKKGDTVEQRGDTDSNGSKPVDAVDAADYLKQAFDKGSGLSLEEASKEIEESFKKKEPTRLRLDPEDAPYTGNDVADKAVSLAKEYAGGVGYKLGAGSKGGKAFDCSSFVAHVLGKPWMDTDSIWRDAKGKQKHYEQVQHGRQQAGDVVVYPDYRERGKVHQGHVAILVDPRPESMTMVDASESDRGVHYRKMSPAFAQRERVIFARPVMRKALDAYDLLEGEIWREAA